MFLLNKYHTWYHQIIENALLNNRIKHKRSNVNYKYYEKHHILPKAMNGNDTNNNLVLLTAREHFICHKLLTKMTVGPAYHKMCNALLCMSRSRYNQDRYIISSRDFAYIRKCVADKNSALFSGVPKSPAHKEKIRLANTGGVRSNEYKEYCKERNKKSWAEGVFDTRPCHSQETKEKIKSARQNQIITNETKKKISKSMTGKKHSELTKKKMSAARKTIPRTWIKQPNERIYGQILLVDLEYWLSLGWVKGKYQKDAICVILRAH
jgi:hypothetical protein